MQISFVHGLHPDQHPDHPGWTVGTVQPEELNLKSSTLAQSVQ